jgi:aldose 1-epimerase
MKPLPRILGWLALAGWLSAPAYAADTGITSQPFGQTKEGTTVEIYTLRNANGCEARITNYGGIIVSLKVPDRQGHLDDVVLGFDTLDGYLTPAYAKSNPYFGALIGRYANRINHGRFPLDGKEYQITLNNNGNSLHGGKVGFNQRVWQADEISGPEGPALALRYVSKDGEEGFPGTLTVETVYTLTGKNELKTEFTATTDQDTVVNLTQHSYFNLKGAGNGDILDHMMTIHADQFTPIDPKFIPLGGLRPVQGTPLDFNRPTRIGERIGADDEQLKNALGYDHNFVTTGYTAGAAPRVIARVEEPTTGRVLEVASDQPGVQFYSGNFLDGTLTGKGGKVYNQHGGFALEPDHYPDSPNHPEWPSVVLKSGQTYHNTIIYAFSVKP